MYAALGEKESGQMTGFLDSKSYEWSLSCNNLKKQFWSNFSMYLHTSKKDDKIYMK